MVETHTVSSRADVDIEADIHRLMMRYPPLAHDRHRVNVAVNQGMVTLTGYLKAPITRYYLLEHVQRVEGVLGVNAEALFDDESIRLAAGRIVPIGVQVVVEYGAVILAGTAPKEISLTALSDEVDEVPGVHQVILAFDG